MAVTDIASLVPGFVLSFVVVTVGTYVSTTVFGEDADLGYSAVTAAITSLVWFGVTYFVSGAVGLAGYWVGLGPLLAVVAYVVIIDVRYSGGIGRAALISVGTWVTNFLVLYAAAYLGYSSFRALGVPPGI